MLNPSTDRKNYGDMLVPPNGYIVDFAIGTTYSLDLEALTGVPISLSLSYEMDKSLMSSPIFLLEAIRKSTDQFIVFCEAGQIKVPQKGNFLYTQLENNVFEVALENEKSFHPKVWVIKYTNDEGKALYRVIVLSRNLTFDRSWDIVVSLEGERREEKSDSSASLIDFLSFLLPYTTDSLKTKKMQELIQELAYVHFEDQGTNYKEIEFLPIGINGHGKEEIGLFETYHELIIFSPFLSRSTVDELDSLSLGEEAKKYLITRRSELTKLHDRILERFEVYVLKDLVVDGEFAISESSSDEEQPEFARQQDIHAKMYIRRKNGKVHFYLGSANCSHNAFHGNVEFLLHFHYRKYGFKMTHLLEELFGDNEQNNPFERIIELPSEMEPVEDVTVKLEKAIKSLSRIPRKGKVRNKETYYEVSLTFEDMPDEVAFSISPLFTGRMQPLLKETTISPLSLRELGEFYTVSTSIGEKSVERVIKIPTEGIPEERDKEVFQSIIKDKQTFLKYVSFLLADDYLYEAMEQMAFRKKGMTAAHKDNLIDENVVLYESMLKAAADAPEKLADIHQVVSMIQNEEIIPADFEQLYQVFMDALKKEKQG